MVKPSKGKLLIADPFLNDPNFLRTVILLCEHTDEGSVGFVLNKLLKQNLGDFFPDLEGLDIPLYYGGPVETNTIHFIHQYPALIHDTQQIAKDIYWGGNFESVIALAKNNSMDFSKLKFFIGYSGWGHQQLMQEFEEKSWLSTEATAALVFNTPEKDIWKNSIKNMGAKYEMLINFPIDPQLN